MAGRSIGSQLRGPNEEEFTLTDYLGRGAFGEVYRAVGQSSGAIVAVKVLYPSDLDDAEAQHNLEQEANLAAAIRHPNVVRVLHFGTDAVLGAYLMMEYAPDGTLKKLLASHSTSAEQLDLTRATAIMLDIAQGARAVNEHLIHRDIKPDNILISENRFQIADFGISKLIAQRTRTRTFKGVGPITHMAPEAWDQETNTTKIDVYSVGLVFFELLTLRHPFADSIPSGSDFDAWRDAHMFQSMPNVQSIREDAPLQIAQLLLRMAAKRPHDRPDWDEILRVISCSAGEMDDEDEPPTREIVRRAVAKHEQIERQRLAGERRKRQIADAERVYNASFQELISRFDTIVAEFNSEFQAGQIQKHGTGSEITYSLPGAPKLSVRLFPRHTAGSQILGSTLLGGALLSLERGLSANAVLLRDDPDDIYGRWIGYLIDVSALVTPQAALYNLSARPSTVPFGFQSEHDFYSHIVNASGVLDIFNYTRRDDIDQLFRDLIETAYAQ